MRKTDWKKRGIQAAVCMIAAGVLLGFSVMSKQSPKQFPVSEFSPEPIDSGRNIQYVFSDEEVVIAYWKMGENDEPIADWQDGLALEKRDEQGQWRTLYCSLGETTGDERLTQTVYPVEGPMTGTEYFGLDAAGLREIYGEGGYRVIRLPGESSGSGAYSQMIWLFDAQHIEERHSVGTTLVFDAEDVEELQLIRSYSDPVIPSPEAQREIIDYLLFMQCVGREIETSLGSLMGGSSNGAHAYGDYNVYILLKDGRSMTFYNKAGKNLDGYEYSARCRFDEYSGSSRRVLALYGPQTFLEFIMSYMDEAQ